MIINNILVIIIHLCLFIIDVTTSTSECSDGDSFRLLNFTSVIFASSAAVSTGRVVGCRNSRYVDICADDSSDMSDLERITQRACDYITSSKG